MFKNYFKIAWRNILRQKITSSINIGSLSIGMAAVILIVIWMQNELSFDSYHPNADRIYLLKNNWQVNKTTTWIGENSFYPLADAIEENIPEVDAATRMEKIGYDGSETISADDKIFGLGNAIRVDSNWFKVFHYLFREGNASAFYSNPENILVTESRAKKMFGEVSGIGKVVYINAQPFTIAGIIKDNPINSSLQFDIITQYKSIDADHKSWMYLYSKTFIKLNPDVNLNSLEHKINGIIKTNCKADGNITVTMLPLKELRFSSDTEFSAFQHINKNSIYIGGLLAFLLLLVSTINYVNLHVARIATKVKALSICKIIGAGKKNLFAQIMIESLVAGLIALLFAVVLTVLSMPVLVNLSGTNFYFDPFNLHNLLILTGITVAVVLLTGLYPALLLSSFKPISAFKGIVVPGIKHSMLKKTLTVIQFSTAIIMIIASFIIYSQVLFIQKQDVAYKRDQVFTVQIPASAFPFDKEGAEQKKESVLKTLKLELLSTGDIKNAARTNMSSFINENYTISNGITWDGKPENFNPEYVSYASDADLNKIMQFKMVSGRWFDDKIISDKDNVVLNETAVKKFGIKEPVIGRRFNKGIIIGVVKDFYHQNLHQKIAPLVMRTGLPNSASFVIQCKPGHVTKALAATGSLWKNFFPEALFQYSFADDEFKALYKSDLNAVHFTFFFSFLSVLICCIGLLGMTIFMTEQRRKEIGIRKVLGAGTGIIVQLLSKDFAKLVIIAFIIAAPTGSYFMNKWLQSFAYRINTSWWIVALAGIVALLPAFITVSFHTIKAALANPVESLRTE